MDARVAPPLRQCTGGWVAPARRRASMLAPSRFRFLNEAHDVSDVGWDDAELSKLWRYNLHYFDDINAADGSLRSAWHVSVMARWIAENPPARGSGWEPYPTSLRIVNWIKWALDGNMLPADAVQSLAVQTRWLSSRLEHHLLGNHLFSNAKALIFAGLFFAGDEADSWLEMGMRIVAAQLPEQILPDGGHFERSTMYHALALEDVEDLCNVASNYVGALPLQLQSSANAWRQLLSPMRRWLRAMCHPDAQIAFFNDAAFAVAPTPTELELYAQRLGEPPLDEAVASVTELLPSGYVRVERGEVVTIIDVAPIGPDYLPAHAHADTLSFEMSVFGQRLFVNSGTSQYGGDAERTRQRGTAAHNTVIVDAADSSEIWAAFRVARRARPTGLVVKCNANPIVQCQHDGYLRLPGNVVHQRRWSFSSDRMEVEDQLSGAFHHAEARLHLHPSVQIDTSSAGEDGTVAMHLARGGHVYVDVKGGALRIENSTWHPEFGLTEPNTCLVVEFHGAVATTIVRWERSR